LEASLAGLFHNFSLDFQLVSMVLLFL